MKKICFVMFGIIAGCVPLSAQVPQLVLKQLATGLNYPVDIKNCGDNRIFIVDIPGYIYIMDKSGNILSTPFLDIHTEVNTTGEEGLLSLAFSPNYKEDGYFYVNYIYGSTPSSTRISRFQVSQADSNVANASSEKILLTFSQPYTNHKGATLMFGADGYLYDSQGDGGGEGDPQNNGQNLDAYLGKMLRLDVSKHDTTYTIPPSNPFAGRANMVQEIWAYGLRNPFRCSFDRIAHDMWIADVGQNLYEEVDFQPASDTGGQNYGWRCYEGNYPFYSTGCASAGFTFPVFTYGHSMADGCAIIGGYVYRGAQFSKLWGLYLCTDYCSARFWSIQQTSPGVFQNDTLQSFLPNKLCSFGEDNNGELYVAAVTTGNIYHITENTDCKPVAYILNNDSVISCGSAVLTALYGDTLNYQWFNSNGLLLGDTSYQLSATETGWYKVQVAKKEPGCASMSDSVFVVPYDTTSLLVVHSSLSTCFAQTFVALDSNVIPAGGVFTGNGVSSDTFYSSKSGIGNQAIGYGYVNLQGCQSNATFNIQVSDTTVFSFVTADSLVCFNSASINLGSFVLPTGGIYSGSGISNDSIFIPSVAGSGETTLNYKFTNGGCVSQTSINVTVFNNPVLSQNISSGPICENIVKPFALDSFVKPFGGTYTGIAVSNDTFSPIQAKIGIDTVYYLYTDSNGCSATDSFELEVNICMGLTEICNIKEAKIFPDPNNGVFELSIYSVEGQELKMEVINALGERCFGGKYICPAGLITQPVALSLAKGLYLLQLTGSNNIPYCKKFVVN